MWTGTVQGNTCKGIRAREYVKGNLMSDPAGDSFFSKPEDFGTSADFHSAPSHRAGSDRADLRGADLNRSNMHIANSRSDDAPERPHSNGHRSRVAVGLLAVASLLLVALALKSQLVILVEDVRYAWVRGEQRAKAETARDQLGETAQTASQFRLVAQSTFPSVVHIDTLRPSAKSTLFSGQGTLQRKMESTGQGSGVVVGEEGYILTNYHVIEGATSVRVRFSDGRVMDDAQVVGVDPPTDLAVLKVSVDGLLAAPWGDSEALEVGDWVMAVGNPFGLDRSVTAGIVSAKNRRHVVHNMPYQDFLQTDAAVNPGNSGGPLVNLRGEVVGVTTAIVGESYQGVGFAIPSSLAKKVYERLRNNGRFERGWLGVAMEEVTPDIARRWKIAHEGVLVTSVVGTPARDAGMAVGDVIVAWNGSKVADPTQLSLHVAEASADSTVQVGILREGKPITLEVRVGTRQLD